MGDQVKHSPGPWKVKTSTGGHRSVIARDCGDDGQQNEIAFTVARAGRSLDEAEANARLIAASPDLYAVAVAQEELINEVSACPTCQESTHCYAHYEKWVQIQNDRRAAIKKAQGDV